eukprot:GEMP01010216.1.p1 GENE.GEMP01010216.1~~GEMP01010216.1.p1  ORF type:complete len:806 (+),score=184.17 GEMP01010216.1:132-2549(+)
MSNQVASGSTYFDKKGEVNELKTLLQSVAMEKDNIKKRDVMKKVIAYMTLGIDVSRLFSEMVMASATSDLVQKKMIYLYLANYAECNQEIAILAVNTLQKDFRDDDPMIRGLALRSLCSLRLLNMLEYLEPAIKTGLQDVSGYVRKTAIVGTLKLFHMAPAVVREGDFCDTMYRLIGDQDVHVVQNAIYALEEILEHEGGMVLTQAMVTHLLNRIMQFSEWGQCVMLRLLSRYDVKSDKEMFDIMDILDNLLKQSSAASVVATAKVFLHMVANRQPNMQAHVSERLKPVLLTLAATSTAELAYTVLIHVQLMLKVNPQASSDIWGADFKQFFCRYNDPSYLKTVKLDILTLIVRDETVEQIVAEMSEYVTDVDTEIARASIRAIGAIALRSRHYADHIFESLLQLLTLDIDYVSAETMIVMTDLLRKYPDHFTRVGDDVMEKCISLVTEEEGRCSILWILGEYGHHIDNAPYLLEPLVDNFNEEESTLVKLMLLTVTAKLFFKRPPEVRDCLGRLLQHAIESSHPDVKDRALLYYRLLQHDVEEARRIIVGDGSGGVEFNGTDEAHKEDVQKIFNEFNTLCVVYRLPAHKFIEERPPLYTGPLPTGPNIPVADGQPRPAEHYRGYEDGSVCEEEDDNDDEARTHAVPYAEPPVSALAAQPQAVVAPHADLLGDLFGSPEQSTPFDPIPTTLDLDSVPKVESGYFQQQWGQITNPQIHTRPIQVHGSQTSEDIQASLIEHNFFCVASGTLPTGVYKFFLYARARQTQEFFLEVIFSPNANVQVTLKTESPESAVVDKVWVALRRFM